jgi:hypothetical protein
MTSPSSHVFMEPEQVQVLNKVLDDANIGKFSSHIDSFLTVTVRNC